MELKYDICFTCLIQILPINNTNVTKNHSIKEGNLWVGNRRSHNHPRDVGKHNICRGDWMHTHAGAEGR